MRLKDYDIIYFLGIGGIGMSALARWFNLAGKKVSGYDRVQTPLTDALTGEGIMIHFDDAVTSIPEEVISNKDKTLVIYTPAIPKDHQEHAYLKREGYAIMKRSEVLGLISKDYFTIAVAGTHGKTTTSSMIAHILKFAKRDMVAFLGGITTNYETNLVMEGEVGDRTLVVAEADEFDRSFLRLFPMIAVITSADPDHLDIYGDHDSLTKSFRDFVAQINKEGNLFIHESIKEKIATGVGPKSVTTYGMSQGQFLASNITARGGFFEFDLTGFDRVEHIQLGVPGFHNVENAIAAILVCYQIGISMDTIKRALASFRGVKRRFEFIIEDKNITYVDDYAHHPTEISAFLESLREMYPAKKITVIFQPHLYSRTRDFAAGFSESLSMADTVVLMDIYPARELPIAGVDSDMIFNRVTSPVKMRTSKEELLKKLKELDVEVLATIGAGDIDTFVKPIKQLMSEKYAV